MIGMAVERIRVLSSVPSEREGGPVSAMDPDTRGPGPNDARRQGLAFRQHPRWLVFFAGLLGLVVITPPMALRDPEYRAAVFWSVNPLGSLKFVVATTLFVMGWIIFIPLTLRIWRSAWNFEMLPDRLVATHQLSRRRQEIPWTSITAVTKLPPSLFVGSSPRQFSRIALADGTDVLFNPLLDRYSEFVDELRRRVTCSIFDPYPELIQ